MADDNTKGKADSFASMRPSAAMRDAVIAVLIVAVSAAVGAAILAYGIAVRDICLDAGFGKNLSDILAALACSPIIAALYSID